MEQPVNFLIVLATALIPLIVGTIWYNPKILGTAWQKTVGMTAEDMNDVNMAKMIGLGLLYSVFIAAFLGIAGPIVHQTGISSLGQDPNIDPAALAALKEALAATKEMHRTFGHGAFHGVLVAVFFVLPLTGTHALYEKKSFKYVLINTGYWAVSMALMGGVISQWAI